MTRDHDDESLANKLRETAAKVDDALEPGGHEAHNSPGNGATDPFTNDQRPDETGQAHGSVAGIDQRPVSPG